MQARNVRSNRRPPNEDQTTSAIADALALLPALKPLIEEVSGAVIRDRIYERLVERAIAATRGCDANAFARIEDACYCAWVDAGIAARVRQEQLVAARVPAPVLRTRKSRARAERAP